MKRLAALSVVLALSFGIAAVAQTPQSDRDLLISIHQQLHAAGIPDTPTTSSTSTSITAPTTSTSTTAPTTSTSTSTTTSTTVPPTTTSTSVPPTTTTTGAQAQYGTSGTGPGLEPCTTSGTVVTTSAAVTSGPQNSTILLRGGTYATGFTVPQGSTVKPYNCETVQINAAVSVNNNSTIAGLLITAPSSTGWAIRIVGRTNVEIRNAVIKGGLTEAIRVDNGSSNIRFLSVHIDGGVNNHTMKVRSDSGQPRPTNILIRNVLFTKVHYGGGEDLLQLERHGVVTIDHVTFRDNPTGEDGLDVKTGDGLTVIGSLFEGANINIECLLMNGAPAQPTLIESNRFNNCTAMLGANNTGSPTWNFRTNLLVGSLLHLRRSSNAQITGNVWQGGGQVRLGTSASGDYPTNAFLSNNNFGSAQWVVSNSNSNYICDGTNSGTGGAGGACS